MIMLIIMMVMYKPQIVELLIMMIMFKPVSNGRNIDHDENV